MTSNSARASASVLAWIGDDALKDWRLAEGSSVKASRAVANEGANFVGARSSIETRLGGAVVNYLVAHLSSESGNTVALEGAGQIRAANSSRSVAWTGCAFVDVGLAS